MNREATMSHARTGSLRCLATFYLALGLIAGPSSQTLLDGAAPSGENGMPPFPELADMPVLRWSPEQRIVLTGVPMSLWTFNTSASLMTAAYTLAGQAAYFQRVLVQGDVLVLSGLAQGRHWLAELRSTGNGTAGRISALSHGMRMPQPRAPLSPEAARPLWHPPWSTLVFSVGSDEQGEPSLAMLKVPDPLEPARKKMAAHLFERQWLPAQGAATPDTWNSGAAQLRLFFDCSDGCTVLGCLRTASEQ